MEQEPVALGHDVQVVDPDVRGYVYSLVTAVSAFTPRLSREYSWTLTDTPDSSSEASMAKMQINMCWETMPWHAFAISSDG